jgi:hypothetical protein
MGHDQSSADERRPNLTGQMRTALVAVRVVHVDNSATQRRAFDDSPRGLDLG